jgi:hypothetical protein
MPETVDDSLAATPEEPAGADVDAEPAVEDDSAGVDNSKAAAICKQVDYYFRCVSPPTASCRVR